MGWWCLCFNVCETKTQGCFLGEEGNSSDEESSDGATAEAPEEQDELGGLFDELDDPTLIDNKQKRGRKKVFGAMKRRTKEKREESRHDQRKR